MRKAWAAAAFVAVLAAFLLWSRRTERAATPRAAPKEPVAQRVEGSRPRAPDPDVGDQPRADAEAPRCDYLVGGHAIDSSGRPVPQASVLLQLGRGGGFRGADLHTVTAADGSFRIEGVSEGLCSLSVHAEGFVTARAVVNSGDGSVEIVLRRPTSVEGMVVDGDGRPVAARLLRLSDPLVRDGKYLDEVGNSGRFHLDGWDPGTLVLRAVTKDGREGEATVEVREGDEIRELRIEVAPPWRSHLRIRTLVARGSPRDVGFERRGGGDDPRVRWKDGIATLLFLDPPGTSVHLCVSEDGDEGEDCRSAERVLRTAPLADPAVVEVLLPELVLVRVETEPPLPDLSGHFDHRAYQRPDGSWPLSPECTYCFAALVDGFLFTEVRDWRPPAAGGVLKVALRRAPVVRGVLLDASGTPIEGAELGFGLEESGTTGPDGRFSFVSEEVGDQILVASRGSRAIAASRVRLEPGRETEDLTLVVPTRQTIRGRVIDEARRPVGGAVIRFVGVLTGPWRSDITYSHANGAYEITVLAWDGFLLVHKKGYGMTPAPPDRAEEIVLPRPAFVRIDVARAAEGWPWFSVRWPDLVPNAIWSVGYGSQTVEVAPGKIEVILDDEPKKTRTIDATQGATAEVSFE